MFFQQNISQKSFLNMTPGAKLFITTRCKFVEEAESVYIVIKKILTIFRNF